MTDKKETKNAATPAQQPKSKESFTGVGDGTSLRSRTSTWFECKVRYEKTMEDGSEKIVTELYTVDAFFSDIDDDDLWFKARLAFITIDEKTDKEKRSYYNYLVQAKSLDRAKRYVGEVMGRSMIDYEVKSLSETKIMDVFEHKAPVKKEDSDKKSDDKSEK